LVITKTVNPNLVAVDDAVAALLPA
jgi:hypothetical protein